jgi:hypothetical protein
MSPVVLVHVLEVRARAPFLRNIQSAVEMHIDTRAQTAIHCTSLAMA